MDTTSVVTEENIQEFSSRFNEPEIIQEVRTIVDDYLESLATGPAFYFLLKLESALGTATLVPQMRQTYDELLLKLRLTAFPMLDDLEQKELLSKHLIYAARQDIDIKNRIHFVFYPYFRGREDQKKLTRLLKAFEDNEELLGSSHIQVSDGQTVRSTIGNWIRDYKFKQPKGGSLGVISYLIQSPDAKNLSKEDSEILKKTISVYDWLRFQAIPADLLMEDLSVSPDTLQVPRGATYVKKEKLVVPPVPPPPRPRASDQPFDKAQDRRPATSDLEHQRFQSPIASRPTPPRVLPPPPRPPVRPVVSRQEPVVRRPESPPKITQEPKPAISEERPASPAGGSPIANRPPAMTSSGEVGRGQSPNEALYRSTLQELAKMREEETRLAAARRPPQVIPPQQPVKLPPAEQKPFSVNEAIIHAGGHQIPLAGPESSGSQEGQVVAGEEQDLNKKLKDLEEKLK